MVQTKAHGPSKITAQAGVILENTCPKCGENPTFETIFVESWEDTGMTLTGKQTWTIRSQGVPAYCSDCSRVLFMRRFLATLLLAAPVCLCAFAQGAGYGNTGLPFVGVVYLLFLLKRIGYCWADWLFYGMELEMTLARRLEPLRIGNSSFRFPAGFVWSGARIGILLVGAYLMLSLGAAFRGREPAPLPVGKSIGDSALNASSFEEILATGRTEEAIVFLSKKPARILQKDGDGETLLHRKEVLEKPELVQYLLEHGADLEARDRGPGSTPLHRAAIYDLATAARMLLKAGAKLNAPRKADHMTPLQTAVIFDKPEAMNVFLEAGANPSQTMPSGLSLLGLARKNNCRKVIPLLERMGTTTGKQ